MGCGGGSTAVGADGDRLGQRKVVTVRDRVGLDEIVDRTPRAARVEHALGHE